LSNSNRAILKFAFGGLVAPSENRRSFNLNYSQMAAIF
jgi:hypothetical protein